MGGGHRQAESAPPRTPKCLGADTLLGPLDELITEMSRASPAEFTVTLGSGTTGRGACAPSTSWSLSRRSAPRVRQLCTCVDFASRLAGRKRARAGPGMLTQPGRSHTSLSRNAMLLLLQQRGEGKAPVVAGRLTRWGPLRHSLTPPHPAKGNSRGARVDEIGGSGRWRRNSGSAAPRAQLTPKLEGTCSARGGRGAAATASPNPLGAGAIGAKPGVRPGLREGRRLRGTPLARPEVPAPALPAYSAAERPAYSPARRAEMRGAGEGWGRRARAPGGEGGSSPGRPRGRSRTATQLPSVTLSPGSGRARARHGLVHVGRRAHARPAPSAALRARSTWSAARPRGRRRPATAGIG